LKAAGTAVATTVSNPTFTKDNMGSRARGQNSIAGWLGRRAHIDHPDGLLGVLAVREPPGRAQELPNVPTTKSRRIPRPRTVPTMLDVVAPDLAMRRPKRRYRIRTPEGQGRGKQRRPSNRPVSVPRRPEHDSGPDQKEPGKHGDHDADEPDKNAQAYDNGDPAHRQISGSPRSRASRCAVPGV
jgi:hypothetical protein